MRGYAKTVPSRSCYKKHPHEGARIIRNRGSRSFSESPFRRDTYAPMWKHNICPINKKAGKRKWKPRQTYQAMYCIPTTTATSPRRRLQRPWLDTIDIIPPLELQPLPGSRNLVLRSDCRLRRLHDVDERASSFACFAGI